MSGTTGQKKVLPPPSPPPPPPPLLLLLLLLLIVITITIINIIIIFIVGIVTLFHPYVSEEVGLVPLRKWNCEAYLPTNQDSGLFCRRSFSYFSLYDCPTLPSLSGL